MKAKPFQSLAAWQAQDICNNQKIVYHLSATDIDEINVALKHAQKTSKPFFELTKKDFVLPHLQKELLQMQQQLEDASWGGQRSRCEYQRGIRTRY